MAELSRFFGIVVVVFTRGEVGQHNKPHVHAFAGDDDVSIAIGSGRVLAGKLRPAELWLLRHWMEQHRDELMDAWEDAIAGRRVRKIAPLRGKR